MPKMQGRGGRGHGTLSEKTAREEQGDLPKNQPIVAWVQIGPSSRCVP
jgi:hypothetical protein